MVSENTKIVSVKTEPSGRLERAELDVVATLVQDKPSAATQDAYRRDIHQFVGYLKQQFTDGPDKQVLNWFIALPQEKMLAVAIGYKSHLIDKKLSENTINRKIASLKSLVRTARLLGFTANDLKDVSSLSVQQYRDTSGLTVDEFKQVIASLPTDSASNFRDLAILKLLWGNALRTSELCHITIGALELTTTPARIKIFGKGRGQQFTFVDLAEPTLLALKNWLAFHPEPKNPEAPLFCSLQPSPKYFGHQLSRRRIYNIVNSRCKQAGIDKVMSGHRIRHSSITAALDATNGDVRKVQKLSRHKNIQTLLIYDDNRTKFQHEVSSLIAF